MDPAILYTSPARIREEVATILAAYGKNNGHIFNLGHGVTPQAKPENVGAFFAAVHELSEIYH
jgi:uroporphyrinogen decarboxylase